MWSCMEAQEIADVLSSTMNTRKSGKKIRAKELSFLFSPSGPLQDTATDNGWGDEFLVLAEKFDETIEKWD